LFLVAALPPTIVAWLRGDQRFLGDAQRISLWLGAAAATSLLIAAKGHERKFKGGNMGQRAWFEANLPRIEAALGLKVHDGQVGTPPRSA
jgi:hypothetical protein